jgi:hypothetical protein
MLYVSRKNNEKAHENIVKKVTHWCKAIETLSPSIISMDLIRN